MGLSNKNMNPGSKSQALKPIMMEEVIVAEAHDFSGKGFDWMDTGKYGAPDLAVRFVLNLPGVDHEDWSRQPQVEIYGDVKGTKDPSTDEYTSLDSMGSAFKVFEAFAALDVELEVTPGNVGISDNVLRQAIDETFYRLRYVTGQSSNGKVYFDAWDRIYPSLERSQYETADDLEETFRDAFISEVEGGWVKRFQPDLIDGGYSMNSNGAAPPSTSRLSNTNESTTDSSFEPDDNLPF